MNSDISFQKYLIFCKIKKCCPAYFMRNVYLQRFYYDALGIGCNYGNINLTKYLVSFF